MSNRDLPSAVVATTDTDSRRLQQGTSSSEEDTGAGVDADGPLHDGTIIKGSELQDDCHYRGVYKYKVRTSVVLARAQQRLSDSCTPLLNVRHGRTVHNAVHCGCQQREGTWIVRTVERTRYTPDGPRKGRNTCLGIFTDRNRAAQCAAPPDLCVPASLQLLVSIPRHRLSCCSMPS